MAESYASIGDIPAKVDLSLVFINWDVVKETLTDLTAY